MINPRFQNHIFVYIIMNYGSNTGLEMIKDESSITLKGKRIGILCHAPSITRDFTHITEIFINRKDCRLSAIFGPQHGIYGQTQDNMIEWEGETDPDS